jgi:hypothetical protein
MRASIGVRFAVAATVLAMAASCTAQFAGVVGPSLGTNDSICLTEVPCCHAPGRVLACAAVGSVHPACFLWLQLTLHVPAAHALQPVTGLRAARTASYNTGMRYYDRGGLEVGGCCGLPAGHTHAKALAVQLTPRRTTLLRSLHFVPDLAMTHRCLQVFAYNKHLKVAALVLAANGTRRAPPRQLQRGPLSPRSPPPPLSRPNLSPQTRPTLSLHMARRAHTCPHHMLHMQ